MVRLLSHKRNYKTKLLSFIIYLCIQFLCITSNIYSQTAKESLLKSIFILRVTNFVEWPQDSKVKDVSTDFNIYIYGDNPFENNLESLVKDKKIKIKNKNVRIKKISSVFDIKNADILFISSSEKYNLQKLLEEAKKYPILTMGDTKGYADKGIMINMYIEEELLRFNVNMKNAKEKKIYISSKLLSNAKKIISE